MTRILTEFYILHYKCALVFKSKNIVSINLWKTPNDTLSDFHNDIYVIDICGSSNVVHYKSKQSCRTFFIFISRMCFPVIFTCSSIKPQYNNDHN